MFSGSSLPAGPSGRGRLCKLRRLIGWGKPRPRCRGELRVGAPQPAGRRGGHWRAERGLQPHAPPPDPGGGRPSFPPRAPRASPPPPCTPHPPSPSSRAPRFVSVVSRAGRRERALSQHETGTRTRRQVRWGGLGSGPHPSPPEPLYGSVLRLSLSQHCDPHSALSLEAFGRGSPAPGGAAREPFLGVPPGPGERPFNLHWARLPSAPLCHHLSLHTSSVPFSPQGLALPSSSLIPNL